MWKSRKSPFWNPSISAKRYLARLKRHKPLCWGLNCAQTKLHHRKTTKSASLWGAKIAILACLDKYLQNAILPDFGSKCHFGWIRRTWPAPRVSLNAYSGRVSPETLFSAADQKQHFRSLTNTHKAGSSHSRFSPKSAFLRGSAKVEIFRTSPNRPKFYLPSIETNPTAE